MKTLAAAVILLVVLTGCATPEARITTFAVAGDSLTAWDNDSFPEPRGEFADVTWLHWAASPTIRLSGGYARQGAFAADIAEAIDEVDAEVLVVMAGSNDIGVTDPATALAAIEAIVAAAGVDAVVVCAIPPQRGFTAEATAHNAALVALAAEHDWAFVDPWVSVRDASGEWVEESTFDGIHPTADGAKAAGALIADAITTAAD